LVVHGSFELAAIEHFSLEHVAIRSEGLIGLTTSNARAIAAARWPRLRFLDVGLGGRNCDASLGDLVPLLARTDLLELMHLGLKDSDFTDELCRELANAPIAPQLRELDLSRGTMAAPGAKALAAAASRFSRLEKLDVSRNWLDDQAFAILREAFSAKVHRVTVGE
jgi:hypothetical protein